MALPKTEFIWMNGKFVKWDDAQIHVLSHVVHYGSSWFEGIRAYNTKKGTAIFRLHEHNVRLKNSMKIYHADLPFTVEEIDEACRETVRINGLKACYIRPIVYRGYNELGVYPLNCPVDVSIAAWEWGKYLGDKAINGVDVCVSSWNRPAPNTLPTMSKAGGNYMNAQLMRIEASKNGFDEAIALNTSGDVSEGSGENVFLMYNNTLYTPPLDASILPGITRNTVLKIADEMGLETRITTIPRGMLYTADEIFFTGTAVEITPVRSVDRISVGDGTVGKITREVQRRFNDVIIEGNDPHGWLDFI